MPNLELKLARLRARDTPQATGRFDDEQLFTTCVRVEFQRTPGVRRLVVRGFFAELINQIGVESVQNKLMESIEKELDITLELAE